MTTENSRADALTNYPREVEECREVLRGEGFVPVLPELQDRHATVSDPVVPTELHHDTAKLVRRFARAIANKLLAAQRKYGYSDNWMRDDWADECRAELMRHIQKGDPRDVAAYCAFLWHHNESTSSEQAATTLTDDQRADLRKLEAAATPGPWRYQENSDAYTHIVRSDANPGMIVAYGPQGTSGQVEADIRFIAAIRNAAPAILAASPVEQPAAAPIDPRDVSSDTGNPEADRLIGRLTSADPDFNDCTDAAVFIRRIVAEHRGPDGFPTWKDAAVDEKQKRLKVENDLRSVSKELVAAISASEQPAPSLADERAAFEYDDVVSICDAHGICLPVDCVEMVVDIVKLSGLLAARAASAGVPADERAAFEAKFPVPGGVEWNGAEYVVRDGYENSYRCDRFVGQWDAWQEARAASATGTGAEAASDDNEIEIDELRENFESLKEETNELRLLENEHAQKLDVLEGLVEAADTLHSVIARYRQFGEATQREMDGELTSAMDGVENFLTLHHKPTGRGTILIGTEWPVKQIGISHPSDKPTIMTCIPSDEPSELEQVVTCLGDDAATLRHADQYVEMADNMEAAARLLESRSPAMAAEAATIGDYDLSTSTGGRGYIAEFFAKRVRNHHYRRYIEEWLAADFACALARYLRDQDAAAQCPATSPSAEG